MGNSGSRDRRAAPLDEDRDISCGGLTTKDAWDIALTWRRIIQGCVRLEVDAHKAKFHVVPTFEWVTFVFDGSLSGGLKDVVDIDQAVAAARASTIVWYALSRCAGFDTNENPTFWRRLFSELYFPVYPKDEIVLLKPRPDRPQLPITDAVRFFDDPANPFPRVRVVAKPGTLGVVLQGFFACRVNDARLTESLERIKPHMLPSWSRLRRLVQVSFDGVNVDELTSLIGDHNTLVPFMDANCESTQQAEPLFYLQSIFLPYFERSQTSAIHQILAYTQLDVVVRAWRASDLRSSAHHSAPTLLGPFDRDETRSQRIRIQTLDMSPTHAFANTFAAICSSLPFSRSIDSMDLLFPPSLWMRNSQDQGPNDWAWIGYAVFHPNAASDVSACCLDIFHPNMSDQGLFALERMAVGNNLAVPVDGDNLSVAYHKARVKASTVALAGPRNDAEVVDTFSRETWIAICVRRVEESMLATSWVQVVLPGYGLAWIRGTSILEIVSVPPGESCIQRLRVIGNGHHRLLRLLSILGKSLRHLELVQTNMLEASEVRELLQHCPLLTSLCIPHDGSCWRKTSELPQLPKLSELELHLKPQGENQAILGELAAPQLDDLRALRIAERSQSTFRSHQDAVLKVLARYPLLKYFSWSDGSESKIRSNQLGYDSRKQRSSLLLSKIKRGEHDVAQGPIRHECRLAFMSVVRQKAAAGSSLGRLSPDIARTIFSLTTSPTWRELFVFTDE